MKWKVYPMGAHVDLPVFGRLCIVKVGKFWECQVPAEPRGGGVWTIAEGKSKESAMLQTEHWLRSVCEMIIPMCSRAKLSAADARRVESVRKHMFSACDDGSL